ncbi:ABC transporter substrate-binding protein [Azohydromonas caseinilytica]|uniref:ABC transporter substrate-binding protein n=1 Tax=Azohydromonas caseinilytica TaxID=2728836 RepID=A0A848FAU6_9BURK|nr:helical backbone metal receptor [Azohydromonas caseinilytica]NML15996.1 ABC transporter substrate-binding protein [Azohydromonas caseinilytica]
MRLKVVRRALVAVTAGLLCSALQAQTAVTDDRGQRREWTAPPQRIVSLLPSLTETLCALDGCARLVGIDRHSSFPPAVQALPRVGGMRDASVEAIARLRPDVVLVALSSPAIERLEALGLKVVALEPRDWEDMQRVARTLAQLLGASDSAGQAQRLWRQMQADVDAAARSVPPAGRGLRVYFEVDSAPFAAGESSFIGQTLARLGARNAVPATLGPFPKLNPEFVVRADPQLVIVSARNAPTLAERPGWARIDALRHGRVCAFDAAQGDLLMRPGPRMGEAARIMARCLAQAAAAPEKAR